MVMFRVRPSSLGEVAANLQAVIGVFDSSVAQVNGQVNGVVNASWVGPDADTFKIAFDAWNEQAVLVRTALATLSSQLVGAEGGYTSNESQLVGQSARAAQANRPLAAYIGQLDDKIEAGEELAEEQDATIFGTDQFAAVMARGGQGQGGGQGRTGVVSDGGVAATSLEGQVVEADIDVERA
jgi:uncharacterized protein YukE